MDSSQIELTGSEVEEVSLDQGSLRIVFSRALIVKSMTGSKERTRWWQTGTLVLEGVRAVAGLPPGPVRCIGGDIDENIYTYRDMIPIPFSSRGQIRCALRFDGQPEPLIAEGDAARLELNDAPRYIEHIRP